MRGLISEGGSNHRRVGKDHRRVGKDHRRGRDNRRVGKDHRRGREDQIRVEEDNRIWRWSYQRGRMGIYLQ